MAKAAKIGDIYVAINARLDKFEKDLKKAESITRKQTSTIQRGFDKLNFNKARNSLISFNRLLVAGFAGWGLKRLAQSAIDTGASFEQLEVKLEQLNKGQGQQLFEKLNKWALDQPITTKKAIDSFTMMQAMGLDPTIEKMQTLVDVGVVLGEDTLQRVAMQLGQTAAMGKLLGQEIRVLGEAGINARRYLKEAFGMTVEEVQKSGMDIKEVIKAIFDGMARDFGGSTEKMKHSWTGLKAVFRSYVQEIERQVMKAGALGALESALSDINDELASWIENNSELIKQKVPEYVDSITKSVKSTVSAIESIWTAWNKLPSDLKKALLGAAVGAKIGGPAGGVAGFIAGGSLSGLLADEETKIKAQIKRLEGMPFYSEKYMAQLKERLALIESLHSNHLKIITQKEEEYWKNRYPVKKTIPKDEEKIIPKNILPDREVWADLDLFFDTYEDGMKRIEDRVKAYGDVLKEAEDAQKEFNLALLEPTELEIAVKEAPQKIADMEKARQERLKKEHEDTFRVLTDLSERTAWAMQDNFSNLFYDAMKGELKSFEDYATSIFDSILRAFSDMAGQMAVQALFGSLTGGTSGGGFFSSLFAKRGLAFDRSGVIPFVSGGIVNRPTIFPFASGVGMMGESGPEGIFPLKRTSSGELGVKAEGASKQTSVSFNIYAIDTQSGAQFLKDNASAIAMAINDEIEGGNQRLIGNVRMVK